MKKILGTLLGKGVGHISKLRGGGGQALPGLVVERTFPSYMQAMLRQLPQGVVVVTGTNGKTTTTKMVVELLRANGLRVLTNPTGSNFTRGIISSLAHQSKLSGRLPYDIGIFELDEAYAKHFAKLVKPRWVLALNVMRDQLDRFGELDTAAKMIGETMAQATDGVIVNGDDARLNAIAGTLAQGQGLRAVRFGVAPKLRRFFPADDELVSVAAKPAPKKQAQQYDVTLADFSGQDVTFAIGGTNYAAQLHINGQHNFQNAAAALALTRSLVPETDTSVLIDNLAHIQPAFGRGELFHLPNGSTLQLLLVKNPAGFRQTLASYPVEKKTVMFAINDNYADGRDVSWLWDVDFSGLEDADIACVTGSRAADMALRLSYDGVTAQHIEPDLGAALDLFYNTPGDKLLITTYTAMLRFHKRLKATK